MSAQIDLTQLDETHPMHGVWTVPCTFDGRRVDISIREEQPDARFAMYEQIGIQAEGALLPCVNEFPVPIPDGDTRSHFDVVLWGPRLTALYESDDPEMAWAVGMCTWQVWALQFASQGIPEGEGNAQELWTTMENVSVIYPNSISSPSHVVV